MLGGAERVCFTVFLPGCVAPDHWRIGVVMIAAEVARDAAEVARDRSMYSKVNVKVSGGGYFLLWLWLLGYGHRLWRRLRLGWVDGWRRLSVGG